MKVLNCDPKGCRAFLRILSTEGRGVRLYWAKLKPKGPKEPTCIPKGPEEPTCKNLKDLTGLTAIRKGGRAFLQILCAEGRGVRLCWAYSNPTGSKEEMEGLDRRFLELRFSFAALRILGAVLTEVPILVYNQLLEKGRERRIGSSVRAATPDCWRGSLLRELSERRLVSVMSVVSLVSATKLRKRQTGRV